MIYHHALLLSPSSSWLHICYAPELLQEPKVVRGAKAGWGACSRVILLDTSGVYVTYRNNTIAIGFMFGEITIYSTITGSQVALLSGHIGFIRSLTFSSDGRLLVSGSADKTVKLWDMQTGGVVKTFYGHQKRVSSVSISMDHIKIASGSGDCTIRLWDIPTGDCLCTIQQESPVSCISFSPLNPQHIFSISGCKIWEWDIDGHQIPSTYDGSYIVFSQDHTQFALCNGNDVTVQNSYSRKIVAKFHVADNTQHYCFSPDGRLIAAAVKKTAYVWDITSQDTHLIETFVGHTSQIASLVFSSSSSLVSAGLDKSVKFWKIGDLPTDNTATDVQSTPLSSALVTSISLQARDGIVVSSDRDGVVKTWDISTGVCKASFQTPVGQFGYWTTQYARVIDNRLIFVRKKADGIYIWETEKGEHLLTPDVHLFHDLRILGDGSKIICLSWDCTIKVWSMWTWEFVCEIKLDLQEILYLDSLCTDSPRIWICSRDSPAQEGWDFGTSGSAPVPFDPYIERPCLNLIGSALQKTGNPLWIKDTVTGRKVFQLSGKYATPTCVQWDGQLLVAGYESGEVLILDFYCILSQVV